MGFRGGSPRTNDGADPNAKIGTVVQSVMAGVQQQQQSFMMTMLKNQETGFAAILKCQESGFTSLLTALITKLNQDSAQGKAPEAANAHHQGVPDDWQSINTSDIRRVEQAQQCDQEFDSLDGHSERDKQRKTRRPTYQDIQYGVFEGCKRDERTDPEDGILYDGIRFGWEMKGAWVRYDVKEASWEGRNCQSSVHAFIRETAREAAMYGLRTNQLAEFILAHLSPVLRKSVMRVLQKDGWYDSDKKPYLAQAIEDFLLARYGKADRSHGSSARWQKLWQGNLSLESYHRLWGECAEELMLDDPSVSAKLCEKRFRERLNPIYLKIWSDSLLAARNKDFEQRVRDICAFEADYADANKGYLPHGFPEATMGQIEMNVRAYLWNETTMPYPKLRDYIYYDAKKYESKLEMFLACKCPKEKRVHVAAMGITAPDDDDGEEVRKSGYHTRNEGYGYKRMYVKREFNTHDENRTPHRMNKPMFCMLFARTGQCRYGDSCKYAHRKPRANECSFCGAINHFIKDCERFRVYQSRRTGNVRFQNGQAKIPAEDDVAELKVATVTDTSSCTMVSLLATEPWSYYLKIRGGREVRALWDTGAGQNFINLRQVQRTIQHLRTRLQLIMQMVGVLKHAIFYV